MILHKSGASEREKKAVNLFKENHNHGDKSSLLL